MENKKLKFKIFQVFKANTQEELDELAEEHHKEDPEFTVEEYMKAFYSAKNIRRIVSRSML